MISLLSALIMTIILEGIVVFVLTRERDWFAVSIACNLITNPALNVINSYLGNILPVILALELTAVIVEALLYKTVLHAEIGKSFFISTVANISSFLLGSALLNFILK